MESLPKGERIQLAGRAIQSDASERSAANTFNVSDVGTESSSRHAAE